MEVGKEWRLSIGSVRKQPGPRFWPVTRLLWPMLHFPGYGLQVHLQPQFTFFVLECILPFSGQLHGWVEGMSRVPVVQWTKSSRSKPLAERHTGLEFSSSVYWCWTEPVLAVSHTRPPPLGRRLQIVELLWWVAFGRMCPVAAAVSPDLPQLVLHGMPFRVPQLLPSRAGTGWSQGGAEAHNVWSFPPVPIYKVVLSEIHLSVCDSL